MAAYLTSYTLHAYLSGEWVDLSGDVLIQHGLSAEWGIDGSGPLDNIADIGELQFTLDNSTGQYYLNGSAPLSGWGWGVPIKVTATDGASTRLLRYYVEEIKLNKGRIANEDTVDVVAVDWIVFTTRHPILAPDIETDKTADYGIDAIVSAMTRAPQATNYDTGNYIFPTIFDGIGLRTTAYAEFVRLTMSEFGHLYLEKDSTYGETLRFENLTARNSGTVAATINASIDEVDLSYGENIINRATATAYPKRIDKELQVLYRLSKAMPIKAGETLEFRSRYVDPTGGGTQVNAIVSSMQTPAAPGGADATLMTLLNFPYAGIEYVIDDTGRHTWERGDAAPLNDVYVDVGVEPDATRITSGVLGPYALFGGYSNYKMTAPSSTDFDLFASGTACTIGLYVDILSNTADRALFTRDLNSSYPPYVVKTDGIDVLIYMSSDGANWDVANGQSLGKLTRNRWVYYEIGYDGAGWFYAFTEGKLITKWYSNISLPASSGTFSIGAWDTNKYTFMGLDSFFIRKGEILHKTDFDPPRRQINATYDGDYLMNSAEDGTGTNLSSSLGITATYDSTSVNYSLTNNSATDAFIIHLQARGRGVYPYDAIEYSAEDVTSINTNDYKEINLNQKYQQNLKAGTAVVTAIVANEKDPRTELRAVSFFANKSAAMLTNFLVRDVGDLVRVVVADVTLDNYYYIQKVDFEIRPGGIIYVTWGLKPAYVIDPDFGGGGGGSETDDGTVGVGASIGGAQKGIYQSQVMEKATITQAHEIEITEIAQVQNMESAGDVSIDTVTIENIYQTQHMEVWTVPGYVERHKILSAQHEDSTAADVVRGDIITGQGATPKWVRLAASVPGGAALLNVLGFVNGDTEPAWKALFDATNPTTIEPDAAAAPGTATTAAHRDHTHAIVGAAPSANVTPEQANAEGTSTSFARSDHMHYIPSGAPSEIAGVQSAAEGTGAAFARTDHAHQVQHGITDNHIVTIDGTTNANEYARFTANGIVGRTESEFKADFNLEIGTDVQAYNSQLSIFKICKTVINPQIVYGIDTQIIVFRAPAAITITRIHISGNDASPTSELDIDLKWADDTTAWTNAAVIDVCDTSSGVKTITSGFDDATVPSGKYIYWQFGAEPHADWTQFYFEIYFTYD